MNGHLAVFKQYAVFSGRAGPQEYGVFCLVNVTLSLVLVSIDIPVGAPPPTASMFSRARARSPS